MYRECDVADVRLTTRVPREASRGVVPYGPTARDICPRTLPNPEETECSFSYARVIRETDVCHEVQTTLQG